MEIQVIQEELKCPWNHWKRTCYKIELRVVFMPCNGGYDMNVDSLWDFCHSAEINAWHLLSFNRGFVSFRLFFC